MAMKGRFCPSPTGYIHLGNARTALFSALAAQHADGVFLLRIEDTDAERSKESYVDQLKEDLQWLGCQWQEGPGHDLGNGPYWQSKRLETYVNYYKELQDKGLAYPCFCSEEQLEVSRKMQRRMGKPPRYAGTCRHLSKEQCAEKVEQGLQPTLRFLMPEEGLVEFDDLVRGNQKFAANDLGDLIIRKTDGMPTFMFCNAIDDSLMNVTIALRGEDHLTNTPRQLLILKALGLTPPQYGHTNLIVGPDNTPLSKRHGSKSIKDLREQGYLPLALVNYMARLGHTYTDHNDLMSFADCAKFFSLDHLVKAPAKYDEKQLHYWQKEAVMQLSEEQLIKWASDVDLSVVPDAKRAEFLKLVRPNSLFCSEIAAWAEDLFSVDASNDEDSLKVLSTAGKGFFEVAIDALASVDDYKGLCAVLKEKCGVKAKSLFMPLRLALTRQTRGPELAGVFELLGTEIMTEKFSKIKEAL
jgi:glutamyl-tRNA synthetase